MALTVIVLFLCGVCKDDEGLMMNDENEMPSSSPFPRSGSGLKKSSATTKLNQKTLEGNEAAASKRNDFLGKEQETLTTFHDNSDNNEKTTRSDAPFILAFFRDWFFTTLIGFLVVTYWRGTWVLLDILTCDQITGPPGDAGMISGYSFCFAGSQGFVSDVRYDSAWQTYLAGNLLLGFAIIIWGRGWWQPQGPDIGLNRAFLRSAIIYIMGGATVCIWHGIWYFLDIYLFPDAEVEASWWISAVLGAATCFILQSGASLLAPPAIFLRDGPSYLPPPVLVTIISSLRSIRCPISEMKKEKDPAWMLCIDIILSYIVLPWGVLGFWRGLWYLMDLYFWNFGDQQAMNLSILYSLILGFGFFFIASEDVVMYFPLESVTNPFLLKVANAAFGRLRTLVLAIGTVNFWRAIWLIWDELLGTQTWNVVLAHLIGAFGLLALGCFSSITAPPSTLGVDAIAHPECADEPFFRPIIRKRMRPPGPW